MHVYLETELLQFNWIPVIGGHLFNDSFVKL